MSPLPRRLPRPPSREVAVLSAVAFSVAVGYGLVGPVLPRFARSFGVGRSQAGLILSVFAFMRIAAALAAGRLVNRIGERLVLATGIGIVGVSSLLAGASQTYAQLLVLRGAGGVGSAMFSVSSMSIVLRSTPPEVRGRAVGLYTGSFLLGNIAGPAVGGSVEGLGLRAPFYVYAVTLLVAGSIGLAMLPRLERADPAAVANEPAAMTLREALRERPYRAALYTNMADHWVAMGVRYTLIPLFVVEALMLGQEWSYRGLLVVALVNAIVLYPAARWVDDRGRKPVMLAGIGVMTSSLVVLALADGLAMYLWSMALLGVGAALLQVAPAAVVGDVAGGRSGQAVAAYQMSGDVGAVLGPYLAGAVVDVTASYPTAFGVTAGVVGLSAMFAIFAPETRKVRA